MCKINSAAIVKINMPTRLGCSDGFLGTIIDVIATNIVFIDRKKLDNLIIVGVIIFTEYDAQNTPFRLQNSGPSAERHAQPATAGCPRRAVPRPRILRRSEERRVGKECRS